MAEVIRITPQQKLMKAIGDACDMAIAAGQPEEDVKATLNQITPIIMGLSNENAESIIAEFKLDKNPAADPSDA